jgi:hypothetical protein
VAGLRGPGLTGAQHFRVSVFRSLMALKPLFSLAALTAEGIRRRIESGGAGGVVARHSNEEVHVCQIPAA